MKSKAAFPRLTIADPTPWVLLEMLYTSFSDRKLRDNCRKVGVPIGKYKDDTARNLAAFMLGAGVEIVIQERK